MQEVAMCQVKMSSHPITYMQSSDLAIKPKSVTKIVISTYYFCYRWYSTHFYQADCMPEIQTKWSCYFIYTHRIRQLTSYGQQTAVSKVSSRADLFGIHLRAKSYLNLQPKLQFCILCGKKVRMVWKQGYIYVCVVYKRAKWYCVITVTLEEHTL